MSGECYYFQQLFADADDQYALVVKEYTPRGTWTRSATPQVRPSPRDGSASLRYHHGQRREPVNFEDPSSTPPPQDGLQGAVGESPTPCRFFPNFTDKTRPYFDTTGRALDALKSIWLNDPTGPLADDALMLSASYYLRKGDYVEADHLYELLRKEFPKSRHIENAYVLGCHCKLM